MRVAASIAFLLAIGSGYFIIRQNSSIPQLADNEFSLPATSQIDMPKKEITKVEPVLNQDPSVEQSNEISTPEKSIIFTGKTKKNITSSNSKTIDRTDIIKDRKNENKTTVAERIVKNEPLHKIENISPRIQHQEYLSTGLFPVKRNSTPDSWDFVDISTDEGQSNAPKWFIGAQISPIYSYREIKNNIRNSYSNRYINDIENGLLALSGGISIKYQPGSKITIQSGFYYSKIGQTIENGLVYGSLSALKEYGKLYSLNNSSGSIEQAYSTSYYNEINGRYYVSIDNAKYIQNFEYLEIPLIIRYKFIDKKIDLHLLGGFSTNLLVSNYVYLKDEKEKFKIGETTDIRKFNYCGAIGFGIEYDISSKIKLNFEPTLKYYINSINKLKPLDTHPYYFGLFTGVSYSF